MSVIVFDNVPFETLAPGVTRSRLEPGGKDGPGGIVRDADHPGGCTWSEMWFLGRPEDDSFRRSPQVTDTLGNDS